MRKMEQERSLIALAEQTKRLVKGKDHSGGWAQAVFFDPQDKSMCLNGAIAMSEWLLWSGVGARAWQALDADFSSVRTYEGHRVQVALADVVREQYPAEVSQSGAATSRDVIVFFNDTIATSSDEVAAVIEKAEQRLLDMEAFAERG